MAARKCEDCKAEEATFEMSSDRMTKLLGDACIKPYAMSLAWTGTFYPKGREGRRKIVRKK